MAEICLDCWNKLYEKSDSSRKYILSEELELCEECGEYKRVIVIERKYYYLHKFRFVLFPIQVIARILLLPYLIDQRRKNKNDE